MTKSTSAVWGIKVVFRGKNRAKNVNNSYSIFKVTPYHGESAKMFYRVNLKKKLFIYVSNNKSDKIRWLINVIML